MTRVTKAIVLFAAVVALSGSTLTAAPPAQRPYVAGYFALELDGAFAGVVSKIEGGNVVGDVAKVPGAEFFVKKQLANVGVRDIVLEFGTNMNAALFNWMRDALQRQATPKNGAVLTIDYKGDVRARLEFTYAHITQITLPAADASSKDPLRFTVRLTPETTRLTPGSGKAPSAKLPLQKTALASSFRLAIDGVDMTRASQVESLTINLPLRRDDIGESRDYEKLPGVIDFPNLVVTMAESHAASVYDWLEDFVIQGNNSDEAEKTGTLEFLSANLSTTLFQITFKHLGIFEIAPVPATNTDAVAKVTVEMYCEVIEFAPMGQVK
jgi:hypothetical protein